MSAEENHVEETWPYCPLVASPYTGKSLMPRDARNCTALTQFKRCLFRVASSKPHSWIWWPLGQGTRSGSCGRWREWEEGLRETR